LLCFGEEAIKLPLETPTAWSMKSGKGFYSLGSLWCLMAHKELKPGEYMRKAGELGVQAVSMNEKAEVLSYFTGAKSETEMIDIAMRT
jgi:hypothetical protein